jgi:hypothetical protein
MEVKHDDIQLVSSCGVCEQDRDKKQKQDPFMQQYYATGYTNFSTINVILIILILLFLFGGIYLLRRSSSTQTRRR